ncbi:MAG: (d)CMP kinase [Puniceicoccales bacterium]|jgi:cytidylate kinase|nr:(d)CMP kinase [Puniceicoccales bacterium]
MEKFRLKIATGCLMVVAGSMTISDAEINLPNTDTKTKTQTHAHPQNGTSSSEKHGRFPKGKRRKFHQQGNKKIKRNVKIVVTIDGGSATKKSPIAKSLSRKFDLIYLETGAIYRTIAYVLRKHKMEPKAENKQKIEKFLSDVSWKILIKNNHACFVIDGEILSDKELRSNQLNADVAVYANLFESIHTLCLKIARKTLDHIAIEKLNGLIAEGRTCGTQCFPEADLKFWFNASSEAKVDFRLKKEGEVDDPLKRDELDKNCPFAPLKEPENAVRIWTHNRSISRNINLVASFIEQRFDEKSELAKISSAGKNTEKK